MSPCRFTQNLNVMRRENAEKLAERALAEAKKKQEDAAKAAAEAAAKEAKENGMTSRCYTCSNYYRNQRR